jgi:beta-lactamase class A
LRVKAFSGAKQEVTRRILGKVVGGAAVLCLAAGLAFGAGKTTRQAQPAARVAAPPLARVYLSPREQAARNVLEDRIDALGRAFPGRVGIAVRDLQTGWTTQWQGSRHFPQQSVSKFWVALTVLDKADRGLLSLEAPVVLRRSDLTVFHQPIRALIDDNGYTTTLNELLVRALTESDNTANDFLLRRAGGPEAVRTFLERNEIEGVRFGPGERLMQSQTAGLTWKQSYSVGDAFSRARAALPMSVRRTAFQRYIADPVDGATAMGITQGLAKLKRGELLSPTLTAKLLGIMSRTKTGPQRLKGGLAPGWSLSHKTGTGQEFGGIVAGYNDVGVITCPGGHSFAIAVLIGKTTAGIPARQKLMNQVVRAAIAYDGALGG